MLIANVPGYYERPMESSGVHSTLFMYLLCFSGTSHLVGDLSAIAISGFERFLGSLFKISVLKMVDYVFL